VGRVTNIDGDQIDVTVVGMGVLCAARILVDDAYARRSLASRSRKAPHLDVCFAAVR
jgi:hypothetical protein